MAGKRSAGILLFRRQPELQVLLGRMGGPFWERRRERNWSIPKGELLPDEEPADAARREFAEEVGVPVPAVELLDLGTVTQRGGKQVLVYAGAGEIDLAAVRPGTFELEWPPRSGQLRQFPELAEVAWLTEPEARQRLVQAQVEFLDRLQSASTSETGR
ncbi:MAG TPA: NUDIX domain-containing protein [Jatrophihabitans sp.]|nr:NUDIX domain-containing protein [Jatrophihabitans sp.]